MKKKEWKRLVEQYETFIELLWDQYLFDIGALSQPWMYWVLFIPAILYGIIFVPLKWTILTIPIWIIPSYFFGGVGKLFKKFINIWKDVTNGK